MTFTELVATATIGTSQRRVPELPGWLVGEPPDESPTARLLDAASAYAVARRAQLPAIGTVAVPPPAPPDSRPEPPERFTGTLAALLGRAVVDHGETLAVTRAVLAEALGWMGESGWRLPDRMTVSVLGQAAADPEVALAAAAPLGARGAWLAGFDPVWSAALAGSGPPVRSDWDEGSRAQRLSYLTVLRARDPAAARGLLAQDWASEAVDDRVVFTELVADTAEPADEAFLTAALADRSKRVAEAARPGLLRIPGSALSGRMRARARLVVAGPPGSVGGPLRLVPLGDDPDLVADGLATAEFSAVSAENRLNAVVASIPPDQWPELAGVNVADLRDADGWNLAAGLAAAAVRFDDPDLAYDLVSTGSRIPALLALLGEQRLAALLADPAMAFKPAAVQAILSGSPRQWSSQFATAVSDWVQRQLAGRSPADLPGGLWERISTSVPVVLSRGWAVRLRELAGDTRLPQAHQRRARVAASVLTLRAAMYDDVHTQRVQPATLDRPQEKR